MYVYIVVYHSGEKTVQWPSGQFIGAIESSELIRCVTFTGAKVV